MGRRVQPAKTLQKGDRLRPGVVTDVVRDRTAETVDVTLTASGGQQRTMKWGPRTPVVVERDP